MTEARHSTHPGYCLAGSRSGVTSLMFAIMAIPLILILGIAIDFSFYVGAQAELNLAADAAAPRPRLPAVSREKNGLPPRRKWCPGSR
jgi:Flp pilus assembly protein TadG